MVAASRCTEYLHQDVVSRLPLGLVLIDTSPYSSSNRIPYIKKTQIRQVLSDLHSADGPDDTRIDRNRDKCCNRFRLQGVQSADESPLCAVLGLWSNCHHRLYGIHQDSGNTVNVGVGFVRRKLAAL
ncbi:unnamed protein product [Acanthoscelides obtectus]|uniref:Uncharacterized protein n=1 Tax=Acanthoscelides obtectus TaxID=200917 RepID=A0A9P0PXJ8_ACAOB|nr:unnamed protein product [Acanthoscelides obtectus]CAK1647537.1 hypothetical protein AOBTE_LOCUS15256 [Acanthoscelides obtectus]